MLNRAPERLLSRWDLDPIVVALQKQAPVTLHVDDYLDDTAQAEADDKGERPRIVLGAALVTGDRDRLYGVLAHEVAHHRLQHLRRPGRSERLWSTVVEWAPPAMVVLAALALGASLALGVIAVVLGGLALMFGLATRLLMMAGYRQAELEADAESVRLLDELGLDGAALATGLWTGYPPEGRWYRLVGWLWGTHPTVAQRRRVVHETTLTRR
jgi:Zn-dependent protease with chaperone function